MGDDNEVKGLELRHTEKIVRLEERVRSLRAGKASKGDLLRLKDALARDVAEANQETRGILGDKINSLNSRVLENNAAGKEAIRRVDELADRIGHIETALGDMSQAFQAHAKKTESATADTLALLNEMKNGSPKALWARASSVIYKAGGVVVFFIILATQGLHGANAAWMALKSSLFGP